MINANEERYKDLLERALHSNEKASTTQGVDIRLLTNQVLHLNMKEVPLITGKKIFWKKAIAEFELWLSGKTDKIKYYHEKGINYWDQFADKDGNLGPIYGYQWVNWNGQGINQIEEVKDLISKGSTRRRLIITGWNVGQLKEMSLPPCVMTYQFNIVSDKYLDVSVYQRSADGFIGVPFDIFQAYLMAHYVNNGKYTLRKLTFFYGNFHIYENHIDQVIEYLNAETYKAPKFINNEIVDYVSGKYIKGEIN